MAQCQKSVGDAIAEYERTGDRRTIQIYLDEAASLGNIVAQRLIHLIEADETILGRSASHPILQLSQRPNISIRRNALSALECSYLVECARDRLTESTVTREQGVIVNPGMRRSRTMVVDVKEMDSVHRSVAERTAALYQYPMERSRPININCYSSGDYFMPHVDAVEMSDPRFKRGVDRARTTILYLNENYEGGETVFLEADLAVAGGTGHLLSFRNYCEGGQVDQLTRHASEPIRRGEKWVCVIWEGIGRADAVEEGPCLEY